MFFKDRVKSRSNEIGVIDESFFLHRSMIWDEMDGGLGREGME